MPLRITSSVHKERDRGSTNTAVCALTLSAPPGFFTHEHAPRHLRYVEIRFEFVAKIVAAQLVPRLNLRLLAIAACLLRLSLHISRRRLHMRGVCETNQLDRKTFGHCRAGTVCTYSLSGEIWLNRLDDRPQSNSQTIAQGRSFKL
jgi:hypothetical protein